MKPNQKKTEKKIRLMLIKRIVKSDQKKIEYPKQHPVWTVRRKFKTHCLLKTNAIAENSVQQDGDNEQYPADLVF